MAMTCSKTQLFLSQATEWKLGSWLARLNFINLHMAFCGGKYMIKVMIVYDQPSDRDSLGYLLGRRQEIEVVGAGIDSRQALEQAERLQPNLIVMDIRMRVIGAEVTKQLCAQLPHVKVLLLTTFSNIEYIVEALEEGAYGYLLRDMPADAIAQAIVAVHHGGFVLPKYFRKQVLSEMRMTHHLSASFEDAFPAPDDLTPRELEILWALGKGLNNKEIADRLFIAEGTVKNYVSNVIQKLNVRDRTQAAIFAVRKGIATPENARNA